MHVVVRVYFGLYTVHVVVRVYFGLFTVHVVVRVYQSTLIMARRITNPCLTCSKSVTNSQRAMFCEICKKWQHLKCSTLGLHDYIKISNCADDWYCTNCIIKILPFINIDDDLEFINCPFNLARGFSASADVIKISAQF